MTISSIGQPAMDGRISANSANASASKTSQRPEVKMPMADAAQVVQNISDKNCYFSITPSFEVMKLKNNYLYLHLIIIIHNL